MKENYNINYSISEKSLSQVASNIVSGSYQEELVQMLSPPSNESHNIVILSFINFTKFLKFRK